MVLWKMSEEKSFKQKLDEADDPVKRFRLLHRRYWTSSRTWSFSTPDAPDVIVSHSPTMFSVNQPNCSGVCYFGISYDHPKTMTIHTFRSESSESSPESAVILMKCVDRLAMMLGIEELKLQDDSRVGELGKCCLHLMYIVKCGRSWYCEKFGFEYKWSEYSIRFRTFFEYINNIPVQDALDVSDLIRNSYKRNVVDSEDVKSFGDLLRLVARYDCASLASIVKEYTKSKDETYTKLMPHVDHVRYDLVKRYFQV